MIAVGARAGQTCEPALIQMVSGRRTAFYQRPQVDELA
jgi:hypothetical protein